MESKLDFALYYASLGLKVFPVEEKGKKPVYKNWQERCTTDPEAIKTIWTRNPQYNLGIATGSKSHLLVVDIDNHDADGAGSLKEWEQTHGKLPDTATVITGSGGAHYYYKTDKVIKGRAGVLPGVDIRSEGNLVAAPPSIHPNGKPYEWDLGADIEDVGITEADDIVLQLVGWKEDQEDKAQSGKRFQLPEVIHSGERDKILFQYAASMQSKKTKATELISKVKEANQNNCDVPLSDQEIDNIINQVFTYPPGTSRDVISISAPYSSIKIDLLCNRTKNGSAVKQCPENFVRVIEGDPALKGKIRYNTMSYNPEYFGQLFWHADGDLHGQWTDTDDSNLISYLDVNYGLSKDSAYVHAFNIITSRYHYNPVIEWLESLPEWDGKSHIENLMPDYLGTDKTPYNTAALKLHMVAAINRVYEPGCKYDHVLVLVGPQGSFKTTFCERLAVHADWYDGNFCTIDGNQAVERLSGKWILEMAELLAVKKQKDVEAFKAFVTATADNNYRQPYGRRPKDRLRQCVFCATTNDYEFESDLTGNRRYMPVRVAVTKPLKNIMSPDQASVRQDFALAWAEALHIYKTQHPALELRKEHALSLQREQDRYLEEDPYLGAISEYLDRSLGRECVQSIWEKALHYDGHPTKPEAKRIIQLVREKIKGWHEIGRQRCMNYGTVKCFERDGTELDLVEVPDGEEVPF